MTEPERKSHSYYDVDKYHKVLRETRRTRKGIWKVLGRITGAMDTFQGFFVAISSFGIIYGTILAIVIGAYYGPFVLLGLWACIIGGLVVVAERSVGKSMQFRDTSIWKKTLGTSLAFLMVLGLLLLLLSLRFFHLP